MVLWYTDIVVVFWCCGIKKLAELHNIMVVVVELLMNYDRWFAKLCGIEVDEFEFFFLA